MADSETRPLLTNYDATSLPPRTSLQSSGGRGKLRFEMRQKMKKRRLTTSTGIFKSLFPSQTQKSLSPATKDEDLPVDSHNSKAQIPTKHSKLYTALNSKSRSSSARLFQKFITVVILFDVLIYIISTEPELSHLSLFFYHIEAVTSTIFAIEYIARLSVCTEKRGYGKFGPIRGRWKYMSSMQALIDAFATFPFFVELLSGVQLPTLTYLRVFRMLRITRTQSCSHAMDAVFRVLYFNREILHVAALLGAYLVLITSVLMYYLRPRGKDIEYVDDPMDFSSIGSTMVLSLLMLTGQGGPSGQLPWYTQMVILLTGIFSIAMFAIPASMLTWGFEAEANRLGIKAKKRALAKRRGVVYNSDTSITSSSGSSISGFGDISTSDEEYLDIIGGGGDEDEVPGMQKAGSSLGEDEFQSLVTRIESIEQSVAQTNVKLDLILERLDAR